MSVRNIQSPIHDFNDLSAIQKAEAGEHSAISINA
jgi:hypothetical protein